MSILKEGYPFVFSSFIAGAALVIISQVLGLGDISVLLRYCLSGLGLVLVVFAGFCLYFFRDPNIEVSQGENMILSPCNGTVLEVTENENQYIIRVFLSIFSVHLQRAPVAGRVTAVEHQKGKFVMAMNPRAHLVNEQNSITIEHEKGLFVVRQIAGFLARRCVSWVKSGDTLKAGDKIGLIKFSSQVDLYVPNIAAIKVKLGDTVQAGITVVGTI